MKDHREQDHREHQRRMMQGQQLPSGFAEPGEPSAPSALTDPYPLTNNEAAEGRAYQEYRKLAIELLAAEATARDIRARYVAALTALNEAIEASLPK